MVEVFYNGLVLFFQIFIKKELWRIWRAVSLLKLFDGNYPIVLLDQTFINASI